MLKEEGYALIGACFEVYNEHGPGFLEEIYHESLEIELASRNIPFDSKKELKTHYKGHLLNKKYFADLVVFDQIIVELKAIKEIAKEHEAQLINYMKITNSKVGYLVNFGHLDSLEWKRFIL